ncbi:Copper transport protein ATOX1 [Trichinella patagoniensis]|uniref:Copper transport protein ATOX1 n=1 Tax=Trichinella patagoniensis TaxID=990121 RepID=A0A0V0Z650_9BILA|nr:Copper transport protein ATOX1 [Trichinella patagoniensis]
MPSCNVVKHGGSVLSGAIKEVTSACLNYLNMRHSFETDSSENALATTLTINKYVCLVCLLIQHVGIGNLFALIVKLHSFEMEMTCSGCAEQVKRVLNRLDDSGKIKNIFFEMNQNKVTVHSSLSKDVLLTALQKTGKNKPLLLEFGLSNASCFEIKNNNCPICHCVYYNISNAITDNIVSSCKENMAFVSQYQYHVLKATIT